MEAAILASLKGEDPFATKKSDWVERYRKQRTETIDKREQRRRDKREENEEYIEQQRQPRIKDNLVTSDPTRLWIVRGDGKCGCGGCGGVIGFGGQILTRSREK